MDGNRCDEWKAAMNEEMRNIERNDTWKLTDLPEGEKALDVKWVYTLKRNGRLKARLVVCGYQQQEGAEECWYSPVVSLTAVKICLSLGVKNGWLIEQLDVDAAFLNGLLKSIVYVKQPKGFEKWEGKVYRLFKALYGLRESPLCWFECLSDFLKEIGFICIVSERCIFVLYVGNSVLYVLVFVDDLLLCGNDQKLIEEVKRKLCKRFSMKVMGPVTSYLGMDIEYDRVGGIMKLSQEKYIEELAKKYRIEDQRKVFKVPMEPGLKSVKLEETTCDMPFRSLIGALMYIAACTRPDVSFCTSYLSRMQSGYSREYFEYALRILKYLFHTRTMCLTYSRVPHSNILDCYVNSDFAGDLSDRKSTSGFVIRVCNNAVMWKSVKQGAVTRASSHAEYYALADATQEVVWIKTLLEEFGLYGTLSDVTIFEDNSGARYLANNGNFTGKSKHIDIAKRFVSDLVERGTVRVVQVASVDNVADTLTKALERNSFEKFRCLLGVR